MKGKTVMAVGLLISLAGVLLIAFNNKIDREGVVIVGGVLFIVVGIINLMFFTQDKESGAGMARFMTMIANAGATVLGICMLIFRSTFEPLVTYVFGAVVAVCALWLLFLLALGTRPHRLPAWLYVFPLLSAAAAVYVFFQTDVTKAGEMRLMVGTGVGLVLMGIGALVIGSFLGVARRAERKRQRIEAQEAQNRQTVDVEPVEAETAQSSTSVATVDSSARPAESRALTTDDLDDE